MSHRFTSYVCSAALLATVLVGCTLEKNDDKTSNQTVEQISSQPGGDMTQLVAGIWDKQIVPHLRRSATDMAILVKEIPKNRDAAGQSYGYRPSSEGSPWNFATKISGTVVSAKLKTRAATADIDVNEDGKADVRLQLGPVIRGTALRDILPFIDFTSFTDQIEFAKLSRALNTRAYDDALKDLPRETLIGSHISAVGAFTVRDDRLPYLVTPISVEVSGK